MITPRPYQMNGLRLAAAALRRGVKRLLTVLPTGGGKTVIASYIARSVAQRGGGSSSSPIGAS